MPIKVLIVDDHRLFREGLLRGLDREVIEIVGEAADGVEAILKARELQPEVILMDIAMEKMNGIDATTAIHQEFPEIRIIGLTMHDNREYIKQMFEAGASGYMMKNCGYRQLTEAIESVHKGDKYLGSDVTSIVINDYLASLEDTKKNNWGLSERELEILKDYASGLSTQDIATKLYLSIKTVSTHKQNILKKLELKSTADLVKFAIKKGIISF